MSLSISNDLSVNFNKIDDIFQGKRGGDSIEINKGMLRAFCKDNDVTYLITYVKLPKIGKDGELKAVKPGKEFSVERNADGHLTWKKGDTEIKLGSCRWEKFKHAVKMFFSSDYRVSYEIEVTKKIDVIRKAYAACLDKENAAAKIISDQQEQAEAAAKQIADQLAAEQEQANAAAKRIEEQNAAEAAAKFEVITNLDTQVTTEESALATLKGDLDTLNQSVIDYNTRLIQDKNDKDGLLNDKKSTQSIIEILYPKGLIKLDTNSIWISDLDKMTLKLFAGSFQDLDLLDLNISTENKLKALEAHIKYIDASIESIDERKDQFNAVVKGINETSIPAKNAEIKVKNDQIDQLRAESVSAFFM